MKVILRHKIVFALLRPLIRVFLFFKYGFRASVFTKKMQNELGVNSPYLILGSHVSLADCFFVSMCVKGAIYYVATDDIFSYPMLSRAMKFLVSPIAKSKGASDIQTVKDCISVSKQGGNVCIFASGNTSYSGQEAQIDSQIARLALLMRCDILLYNTHGLYGVDPRWSNKIRHGKCTGEIVKVIKKDDAKNMSVETLHSEIVHALSVPKHSDEVLSAYKSKVRANFLERFLFVCPDCKGFSTLSSHGEKLCCTRCGYEMEYGENLKLILNSGKNIFPSLVEWNRFQIEETKKLLDNDDGKVVFEDENEILLLNERAKRKTVLIRNAKLQLFSNKIVVSNGDMVSTFLLDHINSIAIQGRNKIILYSKGESFQLKGKKATNHFKYMVYFYLRKEKKGEDIGGILEL